MRQKEFPIISFIITNLKVTKELADKDAGSLGKNEPTARLGTGRIQISLSPF